MTTTRFPPMGTGVLRPDERHPLLSESGRRTLTDLLEAPAAPVWNHHCGDRLDTAGLRQVMSFASLITVDPPRWGPDRRPGWITPFLDHAAKSVPHFRSNGTNLTTCRDDLQRAWWELVPDDAELDDLIWFPTSGTGQAPVVVPTHPVTVSCYYPLLLEAVRRHGVTVRFRADRADWVTVISQSHGGFTVPSWSSVLRCATAQVNLHSSGWRGEGDRERFLQQLDPRIITGDPVSLGHLADLDVALHPKAVVSTAMHLATATRQRLEPRFGCPVVDVYSSTETGPIAAARPGGGMALLQPRLFVEILDNRGATCPPGTPGVVAVTGGMNPYLPLVRYRTGDTATLNWVGGQPVLDDLAGRGVVQLRSASGHLVSSFDITKLLEDLALPRWAVRQRTDGSIVVALQAEAGAGAANNTSDRVTAAVRTALGAVQVIVEPLTATGKVVAFTVDQPA